MSSKLFCLYLLLSIFVIIIIIKVSNDLITIFLNEMIISKEKKHEWNVGLLLRQGLTI